MRVLVVTTMLLASSLCPAFAQEAGKPPAPVPPTDQKGGAVPGQLDQNSQQTRNPPSDRDQSRAGDREMGPDWRIHRDDGRGRDENEPGRDWRMRDRETGHNRDMDRGRYREPGDRDWDRADRDRPSRDSDREDGSRRRVKVCVEYLNGDEYCRYRR